MLRESFTYRLGARYYQPQISRWLSVDPLAEKYPGWSPYNYTADNPVMLVDPDGRDSNPIYGSNGLLRGYDDKGLHGPAIIYDGEFKEGMKQKDILENGGEFLYIIGINPFTRSRAYAIERNIINNIGNDAGRVDYFFYNDDGKQYIHEYVLKRNEDTNNFATLSQGYIFFYSYEILDAEKLYNYLKSSADVMHDRETDITRNVMKTGLGILPKIGPVFSGFSLLELLYNDAYDMSRFADEIQNYHDTKFIILREEYNKERWHWH